MRTHLFGLARIHLAILGVHFFLRLLLLASSFLVCGGRGRGLVRTIIFILAK